MAKFLLMGLPGTGKTTTLKEYVKFLNKQGIDSNFINTDELINKRLNGADDVVQQYGKDHQLQIASDIFAASDPSRAFIKKYGEAAFRLLEERLLIDIIATSHENDWLDFGGRVLLYEGVIKATRERNIIPIFLYAGHETILERLERNDGWKQRPTYKLAAENSKDGKGWIENAKLHRLERLEKFTHDAAIVISVDNKSPEEIVREIFKKVHEFKLNPIAQAKHAILLKSNLRDKIQDKSSEMEVKSVLKSNL